MIILPLFSFISCFYVFFAGNTLTVFYTLSNVWSDEIQINKTKILVVNKCRYVSALDYGRADRATYSGIAAIMGVNMALVMISSDYYCFKLFFILALVSY